jgi:hypothetical protein
MMRYQFGLGLADLGKARLQHLGDTLNGGGQFSPYEG